jgi:tRNA(fMet)-specific endonuclease VapC
MSRFMLDTNTVSYFLRAQPSVTNRIKTMPMESLCISVMTEGELLFDLAKRPDAKQLRAAVDQFLLRVEVLPWDSSAATHYGQLRADLEKRGRTLAPLDMLIGSHAMSVDATLVTNDQAFKQMKGLKVEDWTKMLGKSRAKN